MTYEEALKAKQEIGEITNIKGLEHYVYVGPYRQADFEAYRNFYYENNFSFNSIEFTDELAKKFSSDSRYKLYGLYQQGIIISAKELIL